MKDINQMANTFFNFSSLDNGDTGEVLSLSGDDLETEEEYDAYNDETFGGLETNLSDEDWEQQHEQFAESQHGPISPQYKKVDEISLKQNQIEHRLNNLRLDIAEPLPLTENSVWSYTPPRTNGETPSVLSSLRKVSESFVRTRLGHHNSTNELKQAFDRAPSNSSQSHDLRSTQATPRICTVEEIERNLLKSTSSPNNIPPTHRLPGNQQQIHPFPRPLLHSSHPSNYEVTHGFDGHGPNIPHGPHTQHRPHGPPGPPGPRGPFNQHGPNMPPHPMMQNPLFPHGPPPFQGQHFPRYPPGMPPLNIPPHLRHIPPPGFRMLPPHPLLRGNIPQRAPSGVPYYQMNPQPGPPQHLQRNNMMPMPQHGNRMMFPQPNYHQQRQRVFNGRYESNNTDKIVMKDEYDGLMTAREKQWLLNIQLLQLNTGTPYFDDYYYTVFKERKAKNNKETNAIEILRMQNNRQRRNSDRQENPLTPKVYTPLQFENSLGKLQCGSVTAPRKIIDMDVVSCDKDSDSSMISSKDTRKTKQLLLELEMLYTLFLKAEDLTNPMAINNLKVLRDIKQKQRLRELEMAATPEQKQEVLELVKKESEPVVENPYDYMQKILVSLLQEDKFTSFMNVRKGKMLLLRLLPALTSEQFFPQVVEIWSKLLLSIPIIGRRDTAGDNLLPKFYPLFKRYIQSVKMSDILENVLCLTETVKLENSRSTPFSIYHQGKPPIYFVLLNKFGISAITALFVRSEYLISTNGANENQQNVWYNFILTVSDILGQMTKVPTAIEGITKSTFNKLCQRIPNLPTDKLNVLNKHFVESED